MKPKLITYFSHRRVTNPINSAKSSVINPSCWGVGQQRDQSLDTCSTGDKYHHFFHPPTDPTNPSSFLQVGRRPLNEIDPLHSIRDSGTLSETRAFFFLSKGETDMITLCVPSPSSPGGVQLTFQVDTHLLDP